MLCNLCVRAKNVLVRSTHCIRYIEARIFNKEISEEINLDEDNDHDDDDDIILS